MTSNNYVPPKRFSEGFHCPHCHTYAHQVWRDKVFAQGENTPQVSIEDLSTSQCQKCKRLTLWLKSQMLWPSFIQAPQANSSMPDAVKADFEEARLIAGLSPRAGAALLRLALQKLCVHLGESGKNINADIKSLVKKGAPAQLQMALDALRIVGNSAVHPSEMDLTDDFASALALFDLLNFIVDEMISRPARIEGFYGSLPQRDRDAVEERDKPKP